MGYKLRLPKITGKSPTERIAGIESYLYQFIEQLQWVLNQIDSGVSNAGAVGSIPAPSPVDGVVGVGTRLVDQSDPSKGGWRYRVWKGGTFDLFGEFALSPTVLSALGETGPYISDQITIELPFKVKSIQFSVLCDGANLTAANGTMTDSAVSFSLISPTDFSTTATTITARIVASGTTF